MKISWKEKCKCGHIMMHHEHEYQGGIVKLEECNKCSCRKFTPRKDEDYNQTPKSGAKQVTALNYNHGKQKNE